MMRAAWREVAQVIAEMLALLIFGGAASLALAVLLMGCSLQMEIKMQCDAKCEGPCVSKCTIEGERALDAKLPNPVPMQ